MSTVAVIPARGGSKGIPRKNIASVAGRPLIEWTIAAARAASRLDRVIVSTDDDEIAQVAQSAGAKVIARPAEISDDGASSEAVLLHSLDELERFGQRPQHLAMLQCTSPLMLPQDIDGTLALLEQAEIDSAFSACESHGFLWRHDAVHGAAGINHDARTRLRRQDREAEYLENGAIYAMRVDGFRAARHRFFGRVALHAMPAERSIEIDEPHELVMAEALLLHRRTLNAALALPRELDAIVFDFDGVFTDNSVDLLGSGDESVRCHRGDGMGIAHLREAGIPMLVLSGERHSVVEARCRKLNIPCLHGVDDKATALAAWLGERNLRPAHTVYVGNDVNDLAPMAIVGCAAAVADAHIDVRRAARVHLSARGGQGAVRELADLVLKNSLTAEVKADDPLREHRLTACR